MKRVTYHFLTGAGAVRALLAAALMAGSFASTAQLDPALPTRAEPASPLAAATATPRLIQRILAEEFEAQPAESGEAEELPSFPAQAAAFRSLQLQDEKGQIPAEGRRKAIDRAAMMRERTILAPSPSVGGITPGAWILEGPTNVGGRIRSIAIPPAHPDWMVIGSVGGGTFLNKNDGAGWRGSGQNGTWTYLENLAVTTLAANPITGNIMYAGTGEGFNNADALRGDGIFKSTDSGESWSQLAATRIGGATPMTWVNRLAMSADGAVLLAATGDGLYRSVDAGLSFAQKLFGASIRDVKTHPTVITQAVASGMGQAFYSTDGGASWFSSLGLPAGRVELAWARSVTPTVYASVDNILGEVYKSVDGGASFTLVNTGQNLLANFANGQWASQGWYDNVIWINPVNPNDIIVGGVNIFRSTNGGTSFSKIGDWDQYAKNSVSVHADHHVIVTPPDYDGVLTKTIWFGNDGGLFRVDDINLATTTSGWTHIVGPNITQFYGVAASNGGGTQRILGGAQDNGTALRGIGGIDSWNYIFGGDGGTVAIDPDNSNVLYGEYVHLQIVRSKDGGATKAEPIDKTAGQAWGIGQLLDSRSASTALFIAPFILDPNNSNTMLAGGASLWRSPDARSAWSWPSWSAIKAPFTPGGIVTPQLISAIAVAPSNSDVIWVGHQAGGLFKTANGTAANPAWTPVTSPTLPARYVTRIVFDPNSPQVVYVTYGGFSANNVWKTTDGGVTWNPLPGSGLASLPEVPVRAFAVHPNQPSIVYAGTEVGIFASEDGGVTWGTPADGPVNVSIDQLVWQGQRLYAATHGRGIWSVQPSISGIPTPTPT
ncbi:MAG TPA: hypothetical protein PLQ83_19155, partial [Thermoflexales bacterium]|nr:hypothetical protein [Thermoflexales bacterium]